MLEDRWVSNFERRFTSTYVVALGVLAGFAIFAQVVAIYQFSQRDVATHVVGVASRQRTLSEELSKLAVVSRECTTEAAWQKWAAEFNEVLSEWERVQMVLRTPNAASGKTNENSPEIQQNLDRLTPVFDKIRQAGHGMVEGVAQGGATREPAHMEPLIQQILGNDKPYVRGMNEIVDLYEQEAAARTNATQGWQIIFPTGSLVLLFLLGIFIFRPAGRKMNDTIAALHDSERRFHAFMDNSPVVAYMKDEQGRYVYVNQAFQRLLRTTAAECTGKLDAELLPASVAKALRDNDLAVMADNRSAEILETVPGEKNETRQWLTVKFPFVNQSGKKFLGGASIDMTERLAAEEALRASEKRWQLALRGSNDGLWDWNAVTNEVYFSARWKQILGYSDQEISNSTEEWDERVHPDDLARVKGELEAHLNRKTPYYVSEYRMRCRDGSYRWVLARGQAVWDEQGKPLRMAGSHTDITDRKMAEEQLTLEAAYDPLTQLSNRRRLLEQVGAAFREARTKGHPLCICLCDIDKFKQVNDDCGHAVGDRVLSTFAQILREALRASDIAGRLGGDEFAVILPGARMHEAEATMERVRSRLETMLFAQRDGRPFHISATFGIAELSDRHGSDAELMDAADQALYAGKRDGRNRVNIQRREEKQREKPKPTRLSS
jgi:diguanylate cyclase (GGDEF)-like protein/PAS domain S-box-containing protein